jgi:ketosteroid isomerase-like protein
MSHTRLFAADDLQIDLRRRAGKIRPAEQNKAKSKVESPETSRTLAVLDRDLIERRVRAIFGCLVAGDLDGIEKYAAPDLAYTGGTWRSYPFLKACHGRDACMAMLREVTIYFEILACEIDRIAIDGDRVALHRRARIRNRGAGVVVEIDICNFMRFRDGLVVEFSEYPDTMAVARLEGRKA